MKIYLASYFELQHHGNGRKISISPSKPKDVNVDFKFTEFSPSKEIMDKYYKERHDDREKAGLEFVKEYENQLNLIDQDLNNISKATDKKILEILPFQDGDTLLSWERKGNISYRNILAEYLIKFGYDVCQ